MRIEVFDDGDRPALPMLATRSWGEVRIGAMTAPQRLAQALSSHKTAGDAWWLNGRWLADGDMLSRLIGLPSGRAWAQGDRVVAARVPADAEMSVARLADLPSEPSPSEAPFAEHAGHVLDALPRLLVGDIAAIGGSTTLNATVHASAVIDETQGAVRVEAGATVGPMAVIEGPCWVGPGAVVQAHAHLRPNTSIGAGCKVGGEVSASVMHDCSNKAHYGYLGDSIVGYWCNLGAGTTTSNLKNTHGTIRLADTPGGERVDTGRSKLGTVTGDFVLTGIGTLLSSGTWIEPAVSLATSGLAPKRVAAFSFVTDGEEAVYDWSSWRRTAEAMTSRRGHELGEDYIKRMRGLHDARSGRVTVA